MGEDSGTSAISFANFNPVSLFTVILLAIGVILGSVGMGIGQWARFDTDRLDNLVVDGSTFKTQSLLSRCVSYDLTQEIIAQGLEDPPQSGCVSVANINCFSARLPLVSALDNTSHSELHNSDDMSSCNEMKNSLQVSAAFIILGIIATFVSMILYFPFLHYTFFIAGAASAIISIVLYAVGLGVFLDQKQDFAGYFSLDGIPQDGCLSYGFGITLSGFVINIIATLIGLFAICYKKMCPTTFKYEIKKE